MAAPENGGGESAAVASPPPPAEEEPPGPAAARGARHSAAAGERVGLLGPGYPPGAVAARGDLLGPLEPEEGGGLLPPLEAGSPTEEGSEVLAVTEELAQSLAASSCAVGTTLYLEPRGSLEQGAELSAEEQLVVATENQAAGLTGNLPAERSQAEPLAQPPGQQATATPLAPEELQRVIEQVSKAQKQPPPPFLPSFGAGIGSLLLSPPRAGGYSLPQEISVVPSASGFSRSPQGCSLTAASGSQPVTSIMHNAAQQLQNVAQQVALQQGKAIGTTRCLVHKQLEAICVQVQPGQMKENEKPVPPLAEVQSKAITPSQPVGRNSGLSRLNIINPQIIRIQPVTGTEQQQFFLHSSSEPPVQLLVQRPLAPDGPVSVTKIPTHQTLNGQKTTCATVSATESRNVTLVAASSANTLISSLEKKQKEELKLKKSLKVKTRCGRISRPPKYKAKDYKFIKTEDLADGHQSDSDDYSELSIEDDDEGKAKGMDTLFSPLNYNLKPKMFKCQICEKSYIGKGGLARHYKLNPGHGQLESSQQKVCMNKTNRSVFLDISGGADAETVSLTLSQPIAVTLNNENSLAIGLEESASSQTEQQTGKSAADRPLLAAQQNETGLVHRGPGMPNGPGRRRRSKRRGRPRMTGRSICSGRLNRSGQSPSKSLSNMSTEHIIFRRKAGLKELIQQCDNEDLMELALPRLTKLVTVYEFLLMKVEKGYPAKAFFPDVYREFEELHNMVKKMSQDHFSNSNFLSYQQPVEIKDPKVAESLGITEKLLGKQKIQAIDFSTQCVIKTVGEQMFTEIPGKKRANESSYEELLPSAKRTRVEGILENVKDVYASQNGEEEKSWNLSTLTTKDGFNPLNGMIVLSEDRGITPCIIGSAKHTEEQHKSLDLEAGINSANSDIFQSMRMECSQLVSIQGPDSTSNTSPPCTEALLHAEADSSPEEFVQADFVNENTAGRLTSSEFCNSMVSDDVIDNQSTNLSMNEETDHNGKYQKLEQDEENQSYTITSEQSEQLNDADIADQMQQLEKVFSTSIVPVDHSCKTQTDPYQNPVQETSICTQENLESPIKNLNEFSCGLEEQHAGQHELENAVTVGETVAFEIADESHEFMSQGHEQIFIQTADGLILSHPGTAVLSQAEGIVIVTNADGTTMHIRTPEGVPLETVEALLAMETGGQSEDILLSQSEVEP
ncbi:zinc finger protein 839 isoform X1 [Gopherus evgoodei]|uniref:Zinc finger protein 839 n=1 Tax=Gopherus evgoodei TaxID=1825980 RepID=A0A8C4VNE0_9SAUR|nr:zinc finger protein 839 isoform X1 [Gopherus evgoodei]